MPLQSYLDRSVLGFRATGGALKQPPIAVFNWGNFPHPDTCLGINSWRAILRLFNRVGLGEIALDQQIGTYGFPGDPFQGQGLRHLG